MRARLHLLARAAAMIAAGLCVSMARAQSSEEGPVIIGERPQYDKFHLTRPTGSLDMIGVFQHDVTSDDDGSTQANQWFAQEVLNLETQGYIVHPNFIQLSLAGAFGVSQSFFSSDFGDSTDYGTVYYWDISGTLLRQSKSPVTVYSRREQNWVFRQFGPALEAITTETGAAMELRGAVPTNLEISHLDSTQTDATGREDLSYARDAFSWLSTSNPYRNQTITWNYNFSRVDQSGSFDQYDTHDATLTHESRFGDEEANSLRSMLDYSSQSGNSDFQHFRWDERLELEHSDDFSTHYEYSFDKYDVRGSERTEHLGLAGFEHQLYDSLTTTGEAQVRTADLGEGSTSNSFAADLDTDYKKKVLFGEIDATAGIGWSKTDSEANQQSIDIVDQSATFLDPFPIVLTGTNIDPNSINITDPSGLILYQPGIDYDVTTFPDRVEISRIVGGQIPSGQSVLLDYTLEPLPAVVTTTNIFRTGLRYDIQEGWLNGLGMFIRYTVCEQSVDSPDPTAFVENDFTDILYGLDYNRGGFNIGAEHQTHDANFNPFDSDRIYGRYITPLDANTTLQFASAYTVLEYKDPANQIELWTASAQVHHDFNRKLRGYVILLYRHEANEDFGNVEGVEGEAELRWHHRQTEIFVRARASELTTEQHDESFQFFQVGVRREF